MPGLRVQRLLLVLPVLGALAGLGAYLALQGGPCACPAAIATGTVRGTLVASVGPTGTPNRTMAGAIYFISAGGQSTGTRTSSDGTFSLSLPSGRYQVEGRSPLSLGVYLSCRAPSVVVEPSITTTVLVDCPTT